MARDTEALILQLSADVRKLEQGMARASGVVDKQACAMEQRAAKAAKEMDAAFGHGFEVAQASAAVAFGAISVYALNAAKDAAELESAFQVAFKSGAAEADAFAKNLAQRVGRSVIDVKSGMTDLALVVSGMGLDAKQSLEIVEKLTQRSVDIGSLFNVDDADALRAVISGLTGETEPLKKFGAVINETAVQAELLRLGFKGNAQNASDAAKAIARTNLILQKTAVAEGDAERTAGSLANQVKRAQGEFKDAAIALGTKFIPVATDAVKAATGLVTAFTDMPEGVQLASLALLGLAGASGPISATIKALRALIIAAGAAKVAVAGVGAGGGAGKLAGAAGAGGLLTGSLIVGGGAAFVGGSFLDHEAQKEIDRYLALVHSTKSKALKSASDEDLAFAQGYAEKALKHYQTPGLVGGDFQKEGVARVQNELDLISAEIARRADKASGAIDSQASAALSLLDTQLNAVNGKTTGGATVAAEVKKTAQEAAHLKASLDAVISALSTPDETAERTYADQVRILTDAMHAGLLTAGEYADALNRARAAANTDWNIGPRSYPDQLGDKTDREIDTGLGGIADSFPKKLDPVKHGIDAIGDEFEYAFGRAEAAGDDFVSLFIDGLKQMAAAAAAEDLAALIFGKRDQSGSRSGGAISVIRSVFGFKDGRVPGFANGRLDSNGQISGPGTGRSDSILARGDKGLIRVSDGESIINAEATKRFGPLLKAINTGRLKGFASGRVPNVSRLAGAGVLAGDIGVTVSFDQNGNLQAYVQREAGKVSARVTASGIDQYDKRAEVRAAGIKRDPRVRR